MKFCDEHGGFSEILSGIAKDIHRIEKKIDNINETLNGNGKWGMKTRLVITEIAVMLILAYHGVVISGIKL